MIRNLLFDLGGVIMNIRRENCADAFRKLGMANPDEFLGEYVQAGIFAGIENGSLGVDDFHREIRNIIGRDDVTDTEIDTAFGRFLLGIPRYRLEQLRLLHEHFGMYLLSNTNPIMWHDGIDKAFRQEGHDVNYYFDGIMKSYEAGCMKPDPKIFLDTERKFGIKPEETLFFDDSQVNIDAAARLGFATQLVPPGSEFLTLLKERTDIKI